MHDQPAPLSLAKVVPGSAAPLSAIRLESDPARIRTKTALELWPESATVHAARFSAGPPGLVGRGTGCRFQVSDPNVSEKHAVFICHDSGAWWVYDLASRGGVTVNNQRVLARRIEDGFHIQFGDRGYKVRLVEKPQDWIIDEEKNRFELVRRLHAGTMGELYLAKWAGFDGRTVVIRVFPQGFEENTEDMHRFLRGNEAGGEIRHPNLIRLYRGGRTPNPWRGRRVWWLAMEYLSGGSLRDRLVRATEPLPVSEVVQIGRDLCEALGEIANRRLVHRNINPSCILLTESRQAKLGDFFLLRSEVFESIHQATQADLPQSEYVYHPPEQLDGVHELDGSSDIYSLACCLYEALTLTPPFNPNQSLPAIFQAIRTQDVVPPREINPAVAPALQNVLLQAMHKDPTRRPGSPQELLEQLTNLTQ